MPYKGTDKEAYKIASKGKTKEEKSRIYKRENAKNERKYFSNNIVWAENKEVKHIVKSSTINNIPSTKNAKIQKSKTKSKNKRKFIPKQLLLDDLRDDRSSKTVSNISNILATFIVKSTAKKGLTNYEKNVLRSTIAFVSSEVINKVLEKPLKVIDNIKMFIKVGKFIYKVSVWFDERNKCLKTDCSSVKKVSNYSLEYRKFLHDHPKINTEYYKNNYINLMEENILNIENNKIITKNAIRCKKCGDIIESKGTHDYVSCSCGACAVDGGYEYLRRTFIEKGCYEELSKYK